ncbi:hypothetical protein GJAV_G00144810 [Gymnothorax javanicus]|nr:hypothetical protein GJAV_G00144810 [Gymnothorax javanicus]
MRYEGLTGGKKAMKTISSVSWVFLAMPLIIESQNVVYLKALEGESVLFTCGSEETSTLPKGLYLKRKCVGPESEVMFFSEFGVKAGSHEDGRIQVHGNLSANLVNITLSELQHRDSGLYYCEFVDAGSPTFRFIQGKEEFFLFVETRKNQKDLQCSCPDYPPVLYAISAAVGLLLLIILGLVASHCGKPCGRNKPHTLVPIYEEMIGRQPSNGKGPHCHLDSSGQEEGDTAVYTNPPMKRRQENHYANPGE